LLAFLLVKVSAAGTGSAVGGRLSRIRAMIRNFIIMLLPLVMALSGALPVTTAAAQEDHPDIVYAEHVPLAAHSLMLDVIRSGDRLIAAGERGHIILSDDQGQTWRQAETVPTRSTLTRVFSVGKRLWAAGHDAVILTSSDGGENWTQQYFDPERQQPIMDLYFRDENNGMAVGAYGLMLVTTDGGQDWQDHAVSAEDDAHLNAIIALPGNVLLIAGEGGFSYRSSDGGETWENMNLVYQGSMFGAVTAGASCVLFFGLRGNVIRSCDAGISWEELNSGTEATLLGGVEQEGKVLLVGNSGSVLEYNEANGFTYHEHPSGVDFAAALGLGNGRYILAGEDGVYFYPVQSAEGAE
jgi:photosystem II stability/assembly factor-like uncharacterized protein